MGAIKNYKLEMLVLPRTDLDDIDNIIYNHRAPEGESFAYVGAHLTYDAKQDKNIAVDQYEWKFSMDCEKVRDLERALNDEPTVFRCLLVENINYK